MGKNTSEMLLNRFTVSNSMGTAGSQFDKKFRCFRHFQHFAKILHNVTTPDQIQTGMILNVLDNFQQLSFFLTKVDWNSEHLHSDLYKPSANIFVKGFANTIIVTIATGSNALQIYFEQV